MITSFFFTSTAGRRGCVFIRMAGIVWVRGASITTVFRETDVNLENGCMTASTPSIHLVIFSKALCS